MEPQTDPLIFPETETMAAAAFIAGDWGTSHLRLSLCDAGGRVLESTHGPGIASSKGRVDEVFFE